jgi:hypothetical protein
LIPSLSLLLWLLLAAPEEGPLRQFVLLKESSQLAVVLETREDDRLGFNRRCLVQLRYPDNQVKRSQCFPADREAQALERARDLEVFVALRDQELALALEALGAKGFVAPVPFGDPTEHGISFLWGGRKSTLVLGQNKKKQPALNLSVKGHPTPKTLLTLEDLPPANDPSVAVMDRLGISQVLLLEGRVLATVLDHSWVNEGRRLHTSRVHFLPLKGAARFFTRTLPLTPEGEGKPEAKEPDAPKPPTTPDAATQNPATPDAATQNPTPEASAKEVPPEPPTTKSKKPKKPKKPTE